MRELAFQPADGSWDDYAARDGLRSVLDPADRGGSKNAAIDALHRAALARALGRRRFLRALDFGCGTGRLCGDLAKRAGHVVGVDLTGAMLHRAAHESRPANVDYVRFDGRRLPLADASVDLVVSVYVLQYAVRDRGTYRALLAELARVLAPGGLVAILEQTAGGPMGSGSVGRAARPKDYLEPARGRLRPLGGAPVRLGRPGRLEQRLLLRTALPEPLRRWAARCVVARTERLPREALADQPYTDWLFRFAPLEGQPFGAAGGR